MRRIILMSLMVLGVGCVEAPPYYYAERAVGQTFVPYDDVVGIHPNQTVLLDDANPFLGTSAGLETRWEIEASGDPVFAFYSWATLLIAQPTGEHQYYVALNLQRIYRSARASEDDLPAVRELAIAAFMSVLENFPDSVTYDTTGTLAFNLATPSYQAIVELGGNPQGWMLVTTEGGVVAVKTHDVPPPAEEDE